MWNHFWSIYDQCTTCTLLSLIIKRNQNYTLMPQIYKTLKISDMSLAFQCLGFLMVSKLFYLLVSKFLISILKATATNPSNQQASSLILLNYFCHLCFRCLVSDSFTSFAPQGDLLDSKCNSLIWVLCLEFRLTVSLTCTFESYGFHSNSVHKFSSSFISLYVHISL